MATGQPLLRARGLSVRFGPVRALDGVDVDLAGNEIVALAGENGAGKSTLVRCLAGDIAPDSGEITVGGQALSPGPRAAARLGVGVVWQDLALCANLDVASNLLLGRESRRLMFSASQFHQRATELLDQLGIRLPPTTTPVWQLSGGQKQLVAVARAMAERPRILILDEPTSALGVAESARVEELAASLPGMGTTVLLVSHDLDQMFRLADRIVILRRGRVVAEVRPSDSHPDEVAALLSGQTLDESARHQLSRLQNLAGQLARAEPSSGLEVIMSALAAALHVDQLCVHVKEPEGLKMAASIGLPAVLADQLGVLPAGAGGGQIARALSTGRLVATEDIRTDASWARWRSATGAAGVASSWSIPFNGAGGDAGVLTLMRGVTGLPSRDEVELAALYSGYASSAIERDRLLGELTARNRVLEAIRDVLQALAGPSDTGGSLRAALDALRSGLGATSVILVGREAGSVETKSWSGSITPADNPTLVAAAGEVIGRAGRGLRREWLDTPGAGRAVVATFPAPSGQAALVTFWNEPEGIDARADALVEDAANSLRLALEREASERAQREAMALRSSQDQQRRFLSFLSHELRTPLTAIRGYASSLMSTDVDWDGSSQQRFLERIGGESARLGRLVEDLLDFSAIESGVLRLQPDWCDLTLVAEAARDCLAPESRSLIEIDCDPELTAIWADHDRLEQILVNLFDNAVRHNPPGTRVSLRARLEPPGEVAITVTDSGVGMPPEWTAAGRPSRPPERRGRTGGAGLGLSIARGIAEAHGGSLTLTSRSPGTECVVRLPVPPAAPSDESVESERTGAS